MSRVARARPLSAKRQPRSSHRDLLSAAIHKLQLAEAVVQCSERAATHDMVEVYQLAGVLRALAAMIEEALDTLDQCEAAANTRRGAP